MNRSRVTSIALLLSMFGLAGACSSEAARDTGATDAGGTSTKTDSGTKKDSGGTTTEEDDAGTTEKDAGTTKRDAAAKDSSTSEGGGGSDSGPIIVLDSGQNDASATDASATDASAADAAVSDGAPVGDAAALVCAPGNVTSFTPTWKVPKALGANACTGALVDQIMDCIFLAAPSEAACNTLLAANAACQTCLFSDEKDATYGPLVTMHYGETVSLNVGGCMARYSNDLTASGCGPKVQAAGQCADAACLPTCSDAEEYLYCVDAAATTSCKSFETAADCADAPLSSTDAIADCAIEGYAFLDNAKWYGRLFCTP